jgi:hypothetical protein
VHLLTVTTTTTGTLTAGESPPNANGLPPQESERDLALGPHRNRSHDTKKVF